MHSDVFFFNDPPPTDIYTLSLHDALPIFLTFSRQREVSRTPTRLDPPVREAVELLDRKSTRLNSSHTVISYAVFCLKKKKRVSYHHHPSNHAAEATYGKGTHHHLRQRSKK